MEALSSYGPKLYTFTIINFFFFPLNVSASTDQSTFVEPEFVIAPKDVMAITDDDAKIECVISGQ